MPVDEATLHFQSESLWLLNGILGLIMFGVALDLRPADFKHVIHTPLAPLIGLVSQFMLLPALTFLLTLLLRPPPSISLGMILIASCPGGNFSNFLVHLAKGNTALSVSMTAISTLAAMVMTPVNLSLWGYLHPGTSAIMREVNLDPIQLVLTVTLILVIPMCLGMLCAHVLPTFSGKLHKPFKYGSILFLITFIAVVFSQNAVLFTQTIGAIAFAVFAHNALALSLGYVMGWSIRLPEQDRRAISIEVGIQNSALGLALIFTFFDGLGGMALIAGWWGIWHIAAGLTVAGFWARRPADQDVAAPEAEAAST